MSTNIRSGKVTPTGVAMPEWLSRSDIDNGAWQVQEGQAVRGDAWTDRKARIMRVPYGDDPMARAVRAHEMMHAKVSPPDLSALDRLSVSREAVIAAEEFRVNTLIRAAGFDADALCDGSESNSGKRLAQVGDWNNFVLFISATAGTKACKDLLRGASSVDKDFAEKGKRIEKAIMKVWKDELKRYGPAREPSTIKRAASAVGSTAPAVVTETGEMRRTLLKDEGELPIGFNFTLRVAGMLDSLLKRDDQIADDFEAEVAQSIGDEELEAILDSGSKTWATLIIDRNVPLTRRLSGKLGRKRVASNIGVNPRRIDRMLTDPEKRVFDRTIKGSGGVVLIDQSGSMRLTDSDVMNLVEAAPGCVIIGYSHEANAVGKPNAWILADRGRVCSRIRPGNGGNGVDGPALILAQKLRKKGEPLVWVCDGFVTVADDSEAPFALRKWCVNFVRKHNIHMTPDVNAAVDALKRAANSSGRLSAQLAPYLKQTAERMDRA
jgi:hypothetical protein